jgi:RNA recognition motif-containing protein
VIHFERPLYVWDSLPEKGSTMNTKLYIGNLSKTTSEDDLRKLFAEIGSVISVAIPTNAKTGINKGFGFVDMGTAEGAQEAMKTLNGRVFQEHELRVNESREGS